MSISIFALLVAIVIATGEVWGEGLGYVIAFLIIPLFLFLLLLWVVGLVLGGIALASEGGRTMGAISLAVLGISILLVLA